MPQSSKTSSPKKKLSRSALYFQTHREQYIKYKQAYRKKHQKELKAYFKKYYAEHKKYFQRKKKEYRKTHREELNAYNRAWYKRKMEKNQAPAAKPSRAANTSRRKAKG